MAFCPPPRKSSMNWTGACSALLTPKLSYIARAPSEVIQADYSHGHDAMAFSDAPRALEANTFTVKYFRSLPTWRSLRYAIHGSNGAKYIAATKFRTIKVRSTLELYEVHNANAQVTTRGESTTLKGLSEKQQQLELETVIKDGVRMALEKECNLEMSASEMKECGGTTGLNVHDTGQSMQVHGQDRRVQDSETTQYMTLRGVSNIGFLRGSPYLLSIAPGIQRSAPNTMLIQRSLALSGQQPSYQLNNYDIDNSPTLSTSSIDGAYDWQRLLYWKTLPGVVKYGYEQHDHELMRKPAGAKHTDGESSGDELIALYTQDNSRSWLKVSTLTFTEPVDRETELWALLSCMTLSEKKRLHHTRLDVGIRMQWYDKVQRYKAMKAQIMGIWQAVRQQVGFDDSHSIKTVDEKTLSWGESP